MSDIDEMDSERLNELESILYASIHYNDATNEQQQQQQQALNMDVDSQSMPPPPQQQQQQNEQQQQVRFVSDKRIINNGPSKPRYWADKNEAASASVNDISKAKTSPSVESTRAEEPKAVSSTKQDMPVSPVASAVNALPKNKRPDANSPKRPIFTPQQKQPNALNPVQQLLQQQQQKMRLPQKVQSRPSQQSQKKQPQQIQQKPPIAQPTTKANEYDEPERFDQRLLVAIPSKCSVAKREPVQRGLAPFAKANRKLEQLQRLAVKRQKSKRVQANKKNKQGKEQPIELISLVDSEKSSDADDVIIVPLPPVPIIDVDASDEEPVQPYMEENAMDAADVSLGGDYATTSMTVLPSVMHSPCSSVLSSDDFIVQKDTSRLIADCERATDEDLLVLTENAIRDAAEPSSQAEQAQKEDQAADTSSEYEFVPPSRLEEIKQNYRVDEQQFRARDVYESESDLTEGGIYCKAKPKLTPTIIRNVDSESESSDVEEVVAVNVNKTKRLRKRRSSTNQSQSDPNTEGDKDDDDDTDSDDGVQATGVPGISRGMALERCKRKIRRISQRRNSESAVTAGPRKSVVGDDASSESADDESLPTARQIAERLLMQKQATEMEQMQQDEQAMDSVGSDANTEDEAEMNEAVTERISAVFDRIDQNTRLSKYMPENNQPLEEVTTTNPELEVISDDDEPYQQSAELETDANETEAEPQSHPEFAELQVEHNMSALQEQLRGGDLVGWNDEMCRFYNDSWNGEHFNLQKIQRAMSSGRHEWRIINADRFPPARKRSHLKCTNCFEMGHVRSKCPRPRKPVVCYTCGMTGHAEPRCPNAICLGCGAKQPMYVQKCNKCSFQSRMICQLCKMRGHSTDMCPDKWRRYHSTTRSNVELDSNVQYRQKNCSYCASRGHLFEECRQRMGEFRNSNYLQRIVSHQKVYKDRSGPVTYPIDLNEFFAIETPFHFNWSSEFSKNSIYARFLKTVGLARPVSVDKRKKSAAAMQLKVYSNEYVPNPQATVAARDAVATSSSVIIEELPPEPNTNPNAVEAKVQQEEISSNFQNKPTETIINTKPSCSVVVKSTVPPHDLDSDSNYSFSEHFEVPSSTTASVENVISPGQKKTGPMEDLPDIIPLSSAADDDAAADADKDTDNPMIISCNNQGISMCVNSSKATSTAAEPESSLPDVPSEAKILMARDQTEYLFSPEGRQFLSSAAKKCNVNVRMDFKEYGYVLVIYGLKKNQEDLQIMLLHRNQEVKRKTTEFQSQKPPKRIDVLIRFMRDGINSLTGDLGNAKNHYFRIKELEQLNTKNGYKLAERKRRLLNMILFGQAGLGNGNMHLDQLLIILKRLLNEHSADENATPTMRNEIEEHWRLIFSPHTHPNYEALLQSYGRLDVKNRMTTLNIDPALLGLQNGCKRNRIPSPPPPPLGWQQDATKNRSPKQRALMNAKWSDQQQSPSPPVWKHEERAQAMPQQQLQQLQQQQHNGNNRTPKQRTRTNVKLPVQQAIRRPLPPVWQHDDQQQQQQYNNNNKNRPSKQQRQQPYGRYPASGQQQHQQLQQHHQQQHHQQHHQQQQQQQQQQQLLPCNNMQQRVPHRLQLQRRNGPLQSECIKLLADMEHGDSRNSINPDATTPSVFWSRESLRYLDGLFKMKTNAETTERLQRVLKRSQRGLLSHNDYRAVIKLHSLMEPH
ncbi:uncharacterized protein LOC116806517 [Drosophila grimshawi]|uniref:uncharacterized protein LOC116806517 n=1 Tax=Drosophila grimshawi TaxID=7222 RepID=UPI000C87017E|nr:uncharacterized protein LOC116806517 [Drosophila grimshawi]